MKKMFIMFIDTEMHIFSFFSSSDFQNATSSVPAALSYLTSFLFFSHPLCKSFSIVCTELYLPFLICLLQPKPYRRQFSYDRRVNQNKSVLNVLIIKERKKISNVKKPEILFPTLKYNKMYYYK